MLCMIVFTCTVHRLSVSCLDYLASKAGAVSILYPPTDYSRSARWLNEKAVIAREPFVKWISCFRPLRHALSSAQ